MGNLAVRLERQPNSLVLTSKHSLGTRLFGLVFVSLAVGLVYELLSPHKRAESDLEPILGVLVSIPFCVGGLYLCATNMRSWHFDLQERLLHIERSELVGLRPNTAIEFSDIQSIGCVYNRDPEFYGYMVDLIPKQGKVVRLFSINGDDEDYAAVQPLLIIISRETGIPIAPLVTRLR